MTCAKTCKHQPCPQPWLCQAAPVLVQRDGGEKVDTSLPVQMYDSGKGYGFWAAVAAVLIVAGVLFFIHVFAGA